MYFCSVMLGVLLLCISYANAYLLTQADKDMAVQVHNQWRLKTGAKMLKMTWNDKLADMAARQASLCRFEHSTTSTGAGFQYVGENMGVRYDRKTIGSVIDDWASEIKNYSYAYNTCSGPACGHYTQIVWANSGEVGCAMWQCSYVQYFGMAGYMYYCNYGPGGNYRDQKPFSFSATCRDYQAQDDPSGLCVKSGQPVVPTTLPSIVTYTNRVQTTAARITPGQSGGDCVDIYQYCSQILDRCSYEAGTRYNCRKSCNLCTSGTTIRPRAACFDTYQYCSQILDRCRYDAATKSSCPKSCNLC